MTLEECLAAVQAISQYQDDWDGEGSPAVPARVCRSARIKIWQIRDSRKGEFGHLPNRIYASVNGTIWFEWHTEDGYCEEEIK